VSRIGLQQGIFSDIQVGHGKGMIECLLR